MGKNRKQASLTNVVQYDSNFNLSIGTSTSSSFNSSGSIIAASGFTGSLSGSVFGLGNTVSFSSSVASDLINLESKSASVDISITNINSVTASNIARLSNLESKSSSVDISVSSLNTFSASNDNTSLNSKTGSYATTGSNSFYGTQVFSGSVYIANDLIVQGSSSIQYISASSVSIGTNIVQLNTANPSVRYAGISVQDSGSSAGITGSILWDSLCNRWMYSNPSTIGYSGGLLMSGPRAATLGSEITLTCNYIAKSGGGDHLYDSCIIDDGTTVCVNANLKGSGTISGTNIYASTVSCSPVGKFTSCIDAGSGTFSGNVLINYPSCTTTGNAFARLGASNTNATQQDYNISELYVSAGNGTVYGGLVASYSSTYPTTTPSVMLRNAGDGPLYFSTNGSIKQTITSAGVVGIGINAPVADDGNLVVAGCVGTGQGAANTVAQINIWETTSANKAGLWFGALTNANTGVIGSRTATGNIAFQTYCGGWAERMRIAYNGNVGIGTSSPDPYGFGYTSLTIRGGTYAGAAGMLHLITPTTDSNGQILGQINFNDGVNLGAAISSRRETSNTTSNIQFYTNNCTITEKMRITSAGVVLINNTYTSPYGVLNTYKTPVASNYVDQIVVQGTGNYPSLRLGTYDAYDGVIATTGNDLRILAGLDVYTENHSIMFYTSFNGGTGGAQNYERMRITHAGNVIIQNNKIYGTGEYLGAIWNSNGGNTTWTIGDTPANQTSWNLRVNTSAAKSGGGSWGDSSDGRLKKDVQTIQNALDKINKLNPVTFEWINPEEHNNQYNIGGFIAQEIKEIFPQFINEINAEGKDKDIVGENEVVYGLTLPFKFDAYIVKAIQEQQCTICSQASMINTLKTCLGIN